MDHYNVYQLGKTIKFLGGEVIATIISESTIGVDGFIFNIKGSSLEHIVTGKQWVLLNVDENCFVRVKIFPTRVVGITYDVSLLKHLNEEYYFVSPEFGVYQLKGKKLDAFKKQHNSDAPLRCTVTWTVDEKNGACYPKW